MKLQVVVDVVDRSRKRFFLSINVKGRLLGMVLGCRKRRAMSMADIRTLFMDQGRVIRVIVISFGGDRTESINVHHLVTKPFMRVLHK